MFYIKDLEEKRCIMALYKCNSNKNLKNIITNSNIYNYWQIWWQNDFPKKRNGKPMQMYKNEFVLSASKSKKGIKLERHMEYTNAISSITKWILENYDKKLTRKENKQKFYDMLVQVRKDNYDNLTKIISDNNLSEQGYSLQDTSSESTLDLRNYCLIHAGETITVKNGSYETVLEHLKSIINN